MDTAEIRRRFVRHFEQAGHTVVPSASLLLDDPMHEICGAAECPAARTALAAVPADGVARVPAPATVGRLDGAARLK